MSRAMLSERAAQDERYELPVHYARMAAVDGYLADYQQAAEREARRILAVAEPGDGRRVPAFRVEWGAAPTWERAEASLDAGAPYFKALADSLSAFLSAPDPADYLAEVAR